VRAQWWYARELIAAVAHGEDARRERRRPRGTLRADARYALRRWRRRPGFAAAAVLTLALGIGAPTAIVSVMDAVLFEPLPWPEADRLVAVHGVLPERRANPATAQTWDRMPLTWPGWVNLQDAPALEETAAFHPGQHALGTERDDLVDTMYVSSAFLRLVGVQPVLGRAFRPDEDAAAADIVIVSHEAWQRRFAGRPDVVGEAVQLGPPHWADGDASDPYAVVGVLPPAFRFDGREPEFIIPLGALPHPWGGSDRRYVHAIARLARGVSIGAAETSVRPLVAGPEPAAEQSARLVSFAAEHRDVAIGPIRLLLVGATLLLVLACANVAGLLLGDARARRHEISVRVALGGSRGRVLRQLVVEHTLLAAVAAAVGILMAAWLTPAFIAIAPDQLPRLDEVHIDASVAAFALVLGLATTVVFGIAPSLSLAGTPAASVLAEGGRDGGGARSVAQRTTVVAQLALALVLVVGASLLGETMYRLTSEPLGFDPEHLAVMSTTVNRLPLAPLECPEPRPQPAPGSRGVPTCAPADVIWGRIRDGQTALAGGLVDRLAAVPGVVSAAGVSVAPFNGPAGEFDLRARDDLQPVGVRGRRIGVTDGYFETMGLPVGAGRSFLPTDGRDAVAVVSESLERRVFDGTAVGQTFASSDSAERYTVIGVVPDVRSREVAADDSPAFYIRNHRLTTTQFVVRLDAGAPPSIDALRQAIQERHPQSVVTSAFLMSDRLAVLLAAERFRAAMSAAFGGVALVMAAVGLFALAARRVAERRREIGVRIALGAGPSRIRRLVLRDGLLNVAFGLAAGLPAAFAASQLTTSYLYGVTPTSPRVFVGAALVLGAVALVATLIPARRASRIDPLLALRD
jgi:ABC-type antimicrobial peptide transport system permease subunit